MSFGKSLDGAIDLQVDNLEVYESSDLQGDTRTENQIVLYNSLNDFSLSASQIIQNYSLNLPPTTGTAGQVLATDGTGNLSWYTISGAPGNVSFVGLSVPAPFTVNGMSNSSITTTGTFMIEFTSTGTGDAVLSTSPTLITPVIGVATGTSLNLSGLTASTAVATDASKNLVSVTNTGTGNNVLSTSPTLITPIIGDATGTSLNLSGLTASSLLQADASKNLVSLANGADGEILTMASGAPAWQAPSSPGTGTVTSVSLTVPSILSITGSPITTTGTFAITTTVTPVGTGAIVLASSPTITSPTLTTPIIGVATGTSLNLSGLTASSAVATDASKNLVSVANTGTGNNVLATSPSITGLNLSGDSQFLGNVDIGSSGSPGTLDCFGPTNFYNTTTFNNDVFTQNLTVDDNLKCNGNISFGVGLPIPVPCVFSIVGITTITGSLGLGDDCLITGDIVLTRETTTPFRPINIRQLNGALLTQWLLGYSSTDTRYQLKISSIDLITFSRLRSDTLTFQGPSTQSIMDTNSFGVLDVAGVNYTQFVGFDSTAGRNVSEIYGPVTTSSVDSSSFRLNLATTSAAKLFAGFDAFSSKYVYEIYGTTAQTSIDDNSFGILDAAGANYFMFMGLDTTSGNYVFENYGPTSQVSIDPNSFGILDVTGVFYDIFIGKDTTANKYVSEIYGPTTQTSVDANSFAILDEPGINFFLFSGFDSTAGKYVSEIYGASTQTSIDENSFGVLDATGTNYFMFAGRDSTESRYVYEIYGTTISSSLKNDALVFSTTAGIPITTMSLPTPTSFSLTSSVAMTITSGAGALSITTGAGAMTLTGGAGGIAITSGAGAMTLTTGAGAMTLTGGAGGVAINTGAGAFALTTGAGLLAINAGAGGMTLNAGAGAMTLTTGAGALAINAGAGGMTLSVGGGAMALTTGGGSMSLNTGGGLMTLTTGVGAIAITTGTGGLALSTGAGILALTTGAGAMLLTTGGGAFALTTFAGDTSFATTIGSIKMTCGTGNAEISSNSGAVFIYAPVGGINVGESGKRNGHFQVYTENGATAAGTANIEFISSSTGANTGPGDFTVNTIAAFRGEISFQAKDKFTIRTNNSSHSVSLNTSAATSSYTFGLPPNTGTSGQVLTSTGTSTQWQTLSVGSVTSVAMTVPSFMSITGSPITSAGTLALTASSTGTGAIVLATSPTLTTPVIGAATGTSLNLSGLTASSAVATDASRNLVSVTNTGTGNNVLGTSPTLNTPLIGVATGVSLAVSNFFEITGASSAFANKRITSSASFGLIYCADPASLSSHLFCNADASSAYAVIGNVIELSRSTIISGGTASLQTLSVLNSTTTTNIMATFFSPNLPNATSSFIYFGKLASSNNNANIFYDHITDGSTLNSINIGMVGGASLLSINGTRATIDGTVRINDLTASSAVATDALRNLVSVTNTGTGNNVLGTSPILNTPLIGVATGVSLAVANFFEITGASSAFANKRITSNNNFGLIYCADPASLSSHLFCNADASVVYLVIGNVIELSRRTIISGGTASLQTLSVLNSTTTTNIMATFFSPNLPNATSSFIYFGKLDNSNNNANIFYNHITDGSTLNSINIGMVGGSSSLSINGTRATIDGTVRLNDLTASTAVATDASKNLVSVTNTGTGNNVLATSPTLTTPIIGAATGTSLNLSGLTASTAVATDASRNLVSVTNTGTGNNVLATSPTLTTPIIGDATGTSLNLSGLTASAAVATDASKNLISVTNTGTGNNVLATSPTLTTPVIGAATGTSLALTVAESNTANFNLTLSSTGLSRGKIQFADENHSIFGRVGRNGATEVMDYYSVAQHRFYTGGLIADQTLRMTISSAGVVNIASLTASQIVMTDASRNLVSRPGFSYQYWIATTDTPAPNDTWTTVVNMTKSQGGGNGELVQQGTGGTFRNSNSVPMLYVASFSAALTISDPSFALRIQNNGVTMNAVESTNSNPLTVNVYELCVSSTGRLVNGQDLVFQLNQYSGTGKNAARIRITITTYPLL